MVPTPSGAGIFDSVRGNSFSLRKVCLPRRSFNEGGCKSVARILSALRRLPPDSPFTFHPSLFTPVSCLLTTVYCHLSLSPILRHTDTPLQRSCLLPPPSPFTLHPSPFTFHFSLFTFHFLLSPVFCLLTTDFPFCHLSLTPILRHTDTPLQRSCLLPTSYPSPPVSPGSRRQSTCHRPGSRGSGSCSCSGVRPADI